MKVLSIVKRGFTGVRNHDIKGQYSTLILAAYFYSGGFSLLSPYSFSKVSKRKQGSWGICSCIHPIRYNGCDPKGVPVTPGYGIPVPSRSSSYRLLGKERVRGSWVKTGIYRDYLKESQSTSVSFP